MMWNKEAFYSKFTFNKFYLFLFIKKNNTKSAVLVVIINA